MKRIEKQKFFVVCTLVGFLVAAAGGCAPMDENRKAIQGKDGVFAIMQTSKGDVVLEFFYQQTPLTVVNFVGLAEGKLVAAKGKPFYDGLKFHRVISKANGDAQDFMVQGGDPKGNGTGGPGYQFPDEIVPSLVFDKPGLLAMANSGPATNGSQFFITIAPTDWLDGKHTIFGRVLKGQDVVNKMKTGDGITKVEIIRQGKDAEKFSASQEDFDRLVTAVQAENDKKDAAQQAAAMEQAADFIPGAAKSPDGIYHKTTKAGSGGKIGKGKKVSVHYRGRFLDGETFDSSYDRGKPLEFSTGEGQMISGFDKMTQDMTVGEKRSFVLPPNEAYGSRGAGGVIPPNAYIAFDVEVMSAK
ncbi:MAG: peptidylprolyl isomerase [Spirochaetaceae bacterium]|jgi:cyclophilin family peptidyl-prolyl cis-trans isomerase|nr:peptidylprolyl isomerase [Spirochaetaceae bacterium]